MSWGDDVAHEVDEVPAAGVAELTDEHRRAVLHELWLETRAGLVPLPIALRRYEDRIGERSGL